MDPGVFNKTIPQGADISFSVVLKVAGVPVDITGCSAVMMLRRDFDKPPVLTLSTANSGLVITGNLGQIGVIFEHADTSAVRFPGEELELVYDIELTWPSTLVDRVLQGVITLTKEVTRP